MFDRSLPRRTFLRGLGTCIGLPLLDAMLPGCALGSARASAPRRMVFLYIPNGVHVSDWFPQSAGALSALPPCFESLHDLRDDLLFLNGLGLRGAEALGDGPGDHARSMAAFLTGAHPYKTDGKDIRNGISVDQLAASHASNQCKFASLELGLEPAMVAGRCDSGYSCAYVSNLAWRTESVPVPKDIHPQSVFDRLFGAPGGSPEYSAHVRARRRSILDFATDQARELERQLGSQDRRKVDEYLHAVRDVEKRLADWPQADDTPSIPHDVQRPERIPTDYADYARIMLDLLALALRTDSTRIATFVFANEGSQRSYREIGISEGHHTLSHHGNEATKVEQIAQINRYHATLFGEFLRQLKEIREGDQSLLDNSIIVFGSGIQDGNRHNHHDLPILVAGKGSGTLQTGRRVDFPSGTPLTNLYVSLLERFGIPVESFGDSTGPLAELS